MKQILINLLSNAVKFTPHGGAVTLATHASNAGLTFTVRDTGVGIAPNDISRVLKPFVQVDGRLSRTHEGTGLGLPLADALVRLHGGTMNIESTVDVGTTVTVRLPHSRLKPQPS